MVDGRRCNYDSKTTTNFPAYFYFLTSIILGGGNVIQIHFAQVYKLGRVFIFVYVSMSVYVCQLLKCLLPSPSTLDTPALYIFKLVDFHLE